MKKNPGFGRNLINFDRKFKEFRQIPKCLSNVKRLDQNLNIFCLNLKSLSQNLKAFNQNLQSFSQNLQV